ncbi:hypothetical protein CO174_04535 [Candidatus Uhrbacteria bacterium CG_4_9_14_3_um_filter_50_9]|uniref:Uncharacterized protein n=1 Tax=Candidatus Uhrbacteria bacterium CG_4_9_14_3_um_filter_50_9 TaxID=1975035 RepID=A0A2M7XBI6_9BACT|nr:MAG: hypothetical protein CO174_04535 [Candidatus Uhrbacteria bacterium CG_4_9_14_3_um_filter_50_9]
MSPAYVYHPEPINTQLGRLLRVYMDKNRSIQTLSEELGCTPELVKGWMVSGPDVSLMTRYLTAFESETGISLDRLMVIQAKLSVLEQLKDIEGLRQSNPPLAWLLSRNPELASRIDFDRYCTRSEIVEHVHVVASGIGAPLVAKQIHVNERYVPKWWAEEKDKTRSLPSAEILERIIIVLFTGFIREDPRHTGQDNARFRITAEWTLGVKPEEGLGVSTFSEALDKLFEGMRDDHHSVLENRLGIKANTVGRLLKYEPGDRMTFATIAQVIRAILSRTHPNKLDDFDQAFEEFTSKEGNGQVHHPVLLEPSRVRRPPPVEAPPQAPQRDLVPEESAEQPQPTPPVATQEPELPELIELELIRTLATLDFLLKHHPSIRPRALDALGLEGERREPVETPHLLAGEGPFSTHDKRLFEESLKTLPQYMLRFTQQSPEVRKDLMGAVDRTLVAVSELLQAAEDMEPMNWLDEYARPDGLARSLALGTKS